MRRKRLSSTATVADLVTICNKAAMASRKSPGGGAPGCSRMEDWRCDPGEIAVKEGRNSQIFRLFFSNKSRTSQVHVAPPLAVLR